MKKCAISLIVLFTLVTLTGCGESPLSLEYLSNNATDIVRVTVLPMRDDTSPEIIRLQVYGAYKGSYESGDMIELRIPGHEGELFQERRQLLFFLRRAEDVSVGLSNPQQSIFQLDYDLALNSSIYVFRDINEQDGLEISYQDLLTIWDQHMQTVLREHAPLDFNANIIRIDAGAPSSYPIVIKSMDALPVYMNDVAFHVYTEAFFEENSLVIFFFDAHSGSIRHRVDAVLENGDIYVTRLDVPPGYPATADFARWHIILEMANNDIVSEQFNVIVNERWPRTLLK